MDAWLHRGLGVDCARCEGWWEGWVVEMAWQGKSYLLKGKRLFEHYTARLTMLEAGTKEAQTNERVPDLARAWSCIGIMPLKRWRNGTDRQDLSGPVDVVTLSEDLIDGRPIRFLGKPLEAVALDGCHHEVPELGLLSEVVAVGSECLLCCRQRVVDAGHTADASLEGVSLVIFLVRIPAKTGQALVALEVAAAIFERVAPAILEEHRRGLCGTAVGFFSAADFRLGNLWCCIILVGTSWACQGPKRRCQTSHGKRSAQKALR